MTETVTIKPNARQELSRIEPDRILVTGGAGFIGSHIVDTLLARYRNSRVCVLDALTYAGNLQNLAAAFSSKRVRFVHGCITDRPLLEAMVKPGTLVFHLAAESHVPRSFEEPGLFHRVNCLGTRNVLSAALRGGAFRAIHFSTDEVYGSRLKPVREEASFAPTSPYAQSKADAEQEVALARARGLDVTVLRPSNAVGPRQHEEKLIPRFIGLARTGLPFTLEGDGGQKRTFLPISDLKRAVAMIAEKAEMNATYNIAGAETFSVREIAGMVARAMNTSCRTIHIGDRPTNDRAYMLDGSRLAALGFRPHSTLEETLREMVAGLERDPEHEASVAAPLLVRQKELLAAAD